MRGEGGGRERESVWASTDEQECSRVITLRSIKQQMITTMIISFTYQQVSF